MNHDEYNEIINGEDTYRTLAFDLQEFGRSMIGWTDEAGKHFDILFTYKVPFSGGHVQHGLRPKDDLFVSVMRIGSCGFDTRNSSIDRFHPAYIGEKLNLGGANTTTEKLSELINNVVEKLQK